jgi:hypothetical protein
MNGEGGKSYIVTLKNGKKFGGWWDTGLQKFYMYGSSGFWAYPPLVASIKEVSWEKASSFAGWGFTK